MRKLGYALFLFIAFALIAIPSYTGNDKEVKFSGEVLIKNNQSDKVMVHLYKGNQIIETFTTDLNGKFEMNLEIGHVYTFEIMKEGFITKRVLVNAMVDRKLDYPIDDFEFFCELIPYRPWVDDSKLDFPMILVELNEKKSKFIYVSNYVRMMDRLENEILEQHSLGFEY